MKVLLAEYEVAEDKLSEMLPVIRTFVQAAQADNEHVMHYSGHQYKDTPTRFLHLMKFRDEAGEQYHKQADYTKTFVDKLYPNCILKPRFSEVDEL